MAQPARQSTLEPLIVQNQGGNENVRAFAANRLDEFLRIRHLRDHLGVNKRPDLQPLHSGFCQKVEKGQFFLRRQNFLLELKTVSQGFIFQDNAGHEASRRLFNSQ